MQKTPQLLAAALAALLLTIPATAQETVPPAVPVQEAPAAPAQEAPVEQPPAAPAEPPSQLPETAPQEPAPTPGPGAATPLDAAPSDDPQAPDAGEIPAENVETTVPPLAAGGEIEPLRDENLPHDLTPWGMFMMADWVVKAVMVGLVVASFATWLIAVAKWMEITFAKRRANAGVRRLERAQSLEEALDRDGRRRWRGPVAALAMTAADEAERSATLSADGIKERTAIALSRVEARVARRMNRGTNILATVGSVSPFVGLFGTVWGIMNSFVAISESNTTNLAVVAPGIAEALLATGIGLVAAIPAVVLYNVFARSIAGYRALLSDGSALVMRHLSRDLDRAAHGRTAYPPAPAATTE